MEKTNKPESIYNFITDDGNITASLYGEYNADNETVTNAELLIQRKDPVYLFTYLVSGTIPEIDAYAAQLIKEIQD
jgi:hypothetical protein